MHSVTELLIDLINFSALTGLLYLVAQSCYLVAELVCEGEILVLSGSLALLYKLHDLIGYIIRSGVRIVCKLLCIGNEVKSQHLVELADKSQLCSSVCL